MVKQKNKSHHLATISLIIMGIGFIATIPLQDSFWGNILQGGFEAGLVGGLADWFAVTALFRHPLGIPIPHTALLPKNRQRITAGIISMLENEWLTKESIRKKINTIAFTNKLIEILETEINSQPLQKNVVTLVQHLIKKIEVRKLTPIIEKELKAKLDDWDIKKYLPLLIKQVTERNYDEKTLDYILKEIDEWAAKDSTKYKLGGMAVDAVENIKADGFMQFALKSFSNLVNEEKLGNIIQNLIQKGVASYSDPYNPNRRTLLIHIRNKLESIKTDEKIYEELSNLKSHAITKWESQEQINDILEQFQQKAIDFVAEPSFLNHYLLPFINDTLTELKNSPEKIEAIDTWIKSKLSSFVEKNHSKIGKLVKENLDKLDDKTLINMVETNVGKDLQWIRVNGAVCGFLIGLILVGFRAFF
ncbi:DUF445 domain-containing protein [Bacillus sp. AFS076308]|uniref:DUF445 domain-containing protein n=1 Tax=unclassified Bacillus (in: firmicutes) TaxID=185979 RepID=UPI000BF77D86|nr:MULTISPECIES: DUF445 domain-containing protein [unclassified Bacillus (in: firmicutes)]PFO04249.1 DUF445 domain-containing protein [Bacillus sp. AFS076308]PGV51888.1 DUF445 domain-containing protein [Bacillus sp. AFS037270]